ncbi:MAG TPA: SDR family oxidoreductase [Acidimicrobiales bacterium]|nr:SDR family oxidoreductase [Acidimicrobiales bacterium]
MGELDGKVAIITGAGRGLGRAHAHLFAAEGACVVVNDRGTTVDGTGDDAGLAEHVAEEIRASGGRAVASTLDVASWDSGEALIAQAVDTFGDLHIVVNNAGILRDRALVNMAEEDWDVIMHVDLKGHVVPTRFAAAYWRERSKAGEPVQAAVVNTVSTSGLVGNPGQSHYGTAKAGIAAFTIICAQELARYGVRVNAISPAARTRMTETSPGLAKFLEAPSEPNVFDMWDPANISPLVAYLASPRCDVTGRVFLAQGGKVQAFEPWTLGGTIEKSGRWTIDELAHSFSELLG